MQRDGLMTHLALAASVTLWWNISTDRAKDFGNSLLRVSQPQPKRAPQPARKVMYFLPSPLSFLGGDDEMEYVGRLLA